MTEKNKTNEQKTRDETLSSRPSQDREEAYQVLCQVRLRPESPPVTYSVNDIDLKEGEWVLVPTDHGQEVGWIMKNPVTVPLSAEHIPPAIIRLATTSEIEDYYKNLELEKRGQMACQKLINSLGLKMKLVRVERFFDGSKIIFYYSADGRVDFRELVKKLVKELKIRVEMRQIGIRHEAKLIGGIGCCGRELCCASFLTGFDPISIKMAKAQNLPLNPNKISGFCGRLLCCLTYEYETYKEMSQDLPSLGKACETPDGQGKVVRHNIFKQAVTIAMSDGSFQEYTMDELDGTAPAPVQKQDKAKGGSRGRKQGHDHKPRKPDGKGRDAPKRHGKKQQARKDKSKSSKTSSRNRKETAASAGKNKEARGKKNQPLKNGAKKPGRKRSRGRKKNSRKNQRKKGASQKS